MQLEEQITELCLDWEYGTPIEKLASKYKVSKPFIEAILTGFYGPSKREPNDIIWEYRA